ncbi:hypothetical protein ACH5RR_029291 [Cinchona calisaya]|uniref:Uncharacterized protein n=1 Tax=Cinchona calisaya TaxID=153742 RepID=A0ABD2YV43_9GENT
MLMGNADKGRYIFPLTSLQIGDLQSYLSHLSLFLTPESKKFYVLVDNRPWLQDLVSRPAHLWQLMVTKSRLSPFANTRGRNGNKKAAENRPKPSTSKTKKFRRWFSLVEAATLSRKRALLPVRKLRNALILNSKLHRTLYGFIVFEVAWGDVRGLNYLNELQTDTSLAVEAKVMNRWEFDSIAQAARSISSWFPGTCNEGILLKDYLESATGEVFYDAEEDFPRASFTEDFTYDDTDGGKKSSCFYSSSFSGNPVRTESERNMLHTPPPPDGPCKRRKLMNSISNEADFSIYGEEARSDTVGSPIHSRYSYASDYEDVVEPSQYRDVLILFRFSDPDLPFKLKDIIISDLRLLTLLEAGLPSWVLFLQSYPVFSHIYRPWMCPLARALYVIISIVTVLIGFYDLYKNVPVLKATASHLFGPLFDWIETWEMISRIRYLGTMLFLHHFQKAVKWFLMMTRTIRSCLSMFMHPMAGPFVEFLDFFLPFWNMCIQIVESFFSVFWMVIESSCSLVGNLVEVLLMPLWGILSVFWSIATFFLYPVFWILWEILYAPIHLIVGLYGLLVSIFFCVYGSVKDMWLVMSGIFQFGSGLKSTVSTSEVSMWRTLWNDLFSQIFRAVRSILNGFVAFFTACNRHRLSIYNHGQEFVQRVHQSGKRSQMGSPTTKSSGSFVLSRGGRSSGTWKLEDTDETQYQPKFRKVR